MANKISTAPCLLLMLLTILISPILQAEDAMLNKKPYFTYRIETKGALYQTKINGILLEQDYSGSALNFEQPVNQYMRTGKNRIGFQLSTHTPDDFDNAKITVSLYVNQDGASESEKKLISQITFKASDFAVENSPQQAIQTSMPAVKLDSTNAFLASDNGDVIVHAPQIIPSIVRPHAYYIYQDVDLETPFPEWGFFKADKLDFPDLEDEYFDNPEEYNQKIMAPLYKEHERLLSTLKTEDFNKILPLFSERNKEYDLAMYYPEGTYDDMLKKSFQEGFKDEGYTLKLIDYDYASPTVSDEKNLIRLGTPEMLHFENEEHSLYSKYPIWFYKKDGKWVISR